MSREHHYFVYILASRSRTLYIGVTNNLSRRLGEHQEGLGNAFTKRYNITRLVYFERFQYIHNAIEREKYLKHFTREEKLALISDSNPTWIDLAADDAPLLWEPTLDPRFQRTKQILRFAKDDKRDGCSTSRAGAGLTLNHPSE
jgi:putative endonuclease